MRKHVETGSHRTVLRLSMQTLVMHCEQWVTKFSLLLHEIASEELSSIYDFFSTNTAALRATPESLDDLATVVNLQRSLDTGQSAMAARFEPLQNMFSILEKVRFWVVVYSQVTRSSVLRVLHGITISCQHQTGTLCWPQELPLLALHRVAWSIVDADLRTTGEKAYFFRCEEVKARAYGSLVWFLCTSLTSPCICPT